MSTAELVRQIKQLSNPERLEVMEAAMGLIREDLLAKSAGTCDEREHRLRAAAMAAKALYEPGGELTEWTSLDGEEIADDYTSGSIQG